MASLNSNIDENLYSRQLYALGSDAHNVMKKMSESNVIISGKGGLGNEIAKNTILSGFKAVTIHDIKTVTMMDLSSLYNALESDIDTNRATVCYPKLKELNPYVTLSCFTEQLTNEYIKQFSIVVLTDSLLAEQI